MFYTFTYTLSPFFFQYFHYKSLFWPRHKLWNQEKVTINLNTSVKILLTAEELVKLDEDDGSCDDDSKWTKCMMNYGSNLVGCSLNWFKNNSDYPTCKTVDQMKQMQAFFRSVKVQDLDNFGCKIPCSTIKYGIQKIVETPLTWSTPWVSEVTFDFGSLVYERKKEYYVYDEVRKVIADKYSSLGPGQCLISHIRETV